MAPRPVAPPTARSAVRSYERSVPADARRSGGVHYTPPRVAGPVLDLALAAAARLPNRVCDPSCGGGAFLLSVADRLVAEGVPAAEVVRDRLVGVEIDPAAVAVARRALSGWADQHGARVAPDQVRVHQGDALSVAVGRWPDRPPDGFDLVIGNPPFLSQLARRTARSSARRALVADRFGQLGAYTDDAGLFLLVATELVAPGGVAAMVQPQSLLSARDAAGVRAGLLDRADLVALWAHDGAPFDDAEVHVCAPVLRRRRAGERRAGAVTVHCRVGEREHRSTGEAPVGVQGWGGLLGPANGVPDTPVLPGAELRTVATATAGFRDEYYALRDAMLADATVADAMLADAPSGPAPAGGVPRLVTVGMIDPLRLRWGSAEHRIGGRPVLAPHLDLPALAAADPRVARWTRDRLVPKVLVATQTKVVEAVADPDGSCVPMTPTISVEPSGDRIDVWHLVAALSAPPVAAAAVRGHLGAGRSPGALRWSARAVLDTPLPVDAGWWDRGATLARRLHLDPAPHDGRGAPDETARRDALIELGTAMTRAYGLEPDHPVVSWWSIRLPRR